MVQFSLRWLFAAVGLIAALLALSRFNTQHAFMATFVVLPLFIALYCRFQICRPHSHAVMTLVVTSLLLAASLMAWGSYYHTFVEPSVGILVGGGWSSVGAAAIVGAIAGLIFCPVSLLAYAVVSAVVPKRHAT